MTANEEKVLKIIKGFGGKVHLLKLAKEFGISSEYAGLILEGLQRKGEVKFQGRWIFLPERKLKKQVVQVVKEGVPKKKTASLASLKGMTGELQKRLEKAGYKDLETLANMPICRLMDEIRLELKQAANLINEARRSLKMIS